MNRKKRKERLKHLNAQRKVARRNPFNNEFVGRITQFTTKELELVLDHLYADYAFDETNKVKMRIEYVEKVIQARKDTRRWVDKPPSLVRINPNSGKYRL